MGLLLRAANTLGRYEAVAAGAPCYFASSLRVPREGKDAKKNRWKNVPLIVKLVDLP